MVFSDEKCGWSALKAPAWTSAQATVCDLESGSRKSISVWGPCLCFASPSLLFFFFPSLLSVSLSLSHSLLLHSRHHLHLRHLSSPFFNFHLFHRCFSFLRLIRLEFIIFLHFWSKFHVIRVSNAPENDRRLAGLIEKRFFIFRHFGRFWSQILTLVMVKPGLIVKRSGA